MAVYVRPARKTKLIRCKGNRRDRDKANTDPEFGNKGSIKQLEWYILDENRKAEE